MDDAMKKQQAQKMYNIFCQTLDAEDLKYKEDEKNLTIEFGARGEDLPMDLVVRMNVNMQLVQIVSRIPCTMPEDKRIDGAIAISAINNHMVNGCFDFDLSDGEFYFRMSSSFRDFLMSQESCKYMIYCVFSTIDKYNDKLLMLSKGMLKMEDFLKAEME